MNVLRWSGDVIVYGSAIVVGSAFLLIIGLPADSVVKTTIGFVGGLLVGAFVFGSSRR